RRVSYLPDFYLPDVWGQTGKGVWFEVKGAAPTPEEKRLAQALAKAAGADCYIASGGIPSPSQDTGSRDLLPPGRIDGFHPPVRPRLYPRRPRRPAPAPPAASPHRARPPALGSCSPPVASTASIRAPAAASRTPGR